ncbi:MAG: HAMP domain-containing protein, partial [Marinosulfonomonas sp.]|nr:HAMP domain-containing protein [Marinosulfonomonas sp.]
MRARIKQKWRPSLALVIGGTLAAVLAAPTFGLLMLRALADDIGLRQSVVLIGAGVVLVTVILGYLLWRLILGPVRRLAAQSEAFAAGQSTPYNPQSHYGTRELQELGQSVLDMAEGLFSRQETVRTYTNHVTHELKSPLTALIGAVELLEAGGLTSDQHARMLTTVRQSADRMQALLEGMRQIAVAREPLGQGKCT